MRDGTGPAEFHWLHIPSGNEGVTRFVEYHAKDARTILGPDGRLTLLECFFLCNKWNASGADWKYWL
jgi:hypothetical protein